MSHDPSLQDQVEATLADPWFNRRRNLRMNHPMPERPQNIADKISQGIENMNFQTHDNDGNESSSDSRHSTRGSKPSKRHTSQRSQTAAKQRLPYPESDSLIPGDVPDELEYRTAVEANRRAARERRPPTTKPKDISSSAHRKAHRSTPDSDNSRHQVKASSQETNSSLPQRRERSKVTKATQPNLSHGSDSDSGRKPKTRTSTTNTGARTSKSGYSQELTSRKHASVSSSRMTGDGHGSSTTQTLHRDSNRERSKGARDTRTVPRRQGSELFLGT
ncbi:63fb7f42-3609-485d-af99-ae69dc71f495-CDS [Sclerotinia trifoliorum]|uniref:63fb7f42-3609-485d-af99-ae69dc71f495-CDS n=1 Tax=Sclerotinia trifoliorum TaxID=28548 RepID=A0A8H2ZR91_9HELO|nr:63fb7f42-3609-485d-af99-ae69dc71f495-CDS [Sclerotinia trifoliorum]